MSALLVIVGILVVLAVFVIGIYNKLIGLKIKVQEGASDIDVQLKRRHDLIPNLIETVKGATKFEQETLEKVVQARNQAVNISIDEGSGLSEAKVQAENQLSGALRQFFALAEAYPDLKANQNFLSLQDELTNTEDRILASRRFYNSTVSDYNTYQMQFPAVLFKSLAGAKIEQFFEVEDPSERENIEVKF